MAVSERQKELYIFEEAPVPKAVASLALPTIISQLINVIYNFADTWFVGRTGNPDMVAAVGVCMPLCVIMAALANLFGVGGSSVISRMLGMKNYSRARHVFAFCVYGGFAAAVCYALLMFLARRPLIYLVGGSEETYPYIFSYLTWTVVIGAIPTVGNVLLAHLIRSTGASRPAAFGMALGGVLNILLDPLFMFVLLPEGHEVTGAAIATMISNCIALIYFILYLHRHGDSPVYTLQPKAVRFDNHIPWDVLSVGLPAALQTLFAMISNIFSNALVSRAGSEAVAGMGVARKINMISFQTIMGLSQGALPLIGYSYGSKNYPRIRKTVRFTILSGMAFCALCTIIFREYAESLTRFFINEEGSVYYGAAFLRIIALAGPLTAISYTACAVFQACGREKQAFLLAILRKGLLDIPAMYFFRWKLGVEGLVWATPYADFLSAIIALFMLHRLFTSFPLKPDDTSAKGGKSLA
jgi:multidrug efflux pump